MIAVTMGDPILMERFGVPPHDHRIPHTAHEWFEHLLGEADTPLRQASATTAESPSGGETR